MPWHPLERATLAEELRAAGPDAPTLCEGWRTRHLAAHVVLRETAPLVAAGAVVRPLHARSERAIARLAERSADQASYTALVDRLARGPARWQPMAWTGEAGFLLELFIHTEDVRRGAGPVSPRALAPEHAQAIWSRFSRQASLLYRRSRVGIVLVVPGGPRRAVRRPKGDAGTVIVRGEIGELALHAFGREGAAHVDVLGHPADVEALQRSVSGP